MLELYPDPFLQAHLIRPGIIHLGGRLTPGSIRDQAIRGLTAVQALRRQQLLKSGQRVLIVGAGVAGVFAGLCASAMDIDLHIVDRNPEILDLQRRAGNRIVSPTLYDWPVRHWTDLSYQGWPMQYRETTADDLAIEWIRVFDSARNSGKLKWHGQTEFERIVNPESGPPYQVEFHGALNGDASDGLADRFDIIFLCTAATGADEQGIPWQNGPQANFPFFPFWRPDPLPGDGVQLHAMPLRPPAHGEAAQVVIIGGGDGGLQDLLRVISGGEPARSMLRAIHEHIDSGEANILYRMFDIEHCANRHYIAWSSQEDPQVLQTWHRECFDTVREIYNGTTSRHARLRDTVRSLVRFDDVLLFQEHSVLSRCYGVNRFLATMLEQHLIEHGSHGSPFRFEREAVGVVCRHDEHANSTRAEDHFSYEHIVTFRHANVEEKVLCRAVISRTGRKQGTASASATGLDPAGVLGSRVHRESLPYWIPCWSPKSRKSPDRPFAGISALRTAQACQTALWRCLIGTAVMKNAEGRVFAYNPRFGALSRRKHSEIMGHRPSEYWAPELGLVMEKHDEEIRRTGESLLTKEVIEGVEHYTFRFSLPLNEGGPGSGSLGFDILNEQVQADWRGKPMCQEPTAQELKRFFDYVPCSVAITDRDHRYLYANLAFQRVLAPQGMAALPLDGILGRTWNEIIAGFREAEEEDAGDQRKNTVWQQHTPHTSAVQSWPSHPPANRKLRFVVGFPILNEAGAMIALGTVGFRWDALESVKENPGSAIRYRIEDDSDKPGPISDAK